jgi:hypothetical protein
MTNAFPVDGNALSVVMEVHDVAIWALNGLGPQLRLVKVVRAITFKPVEGTAVLMGQMPSPG